MIEDIDLVMQMIECLSDRVDSLRQCVSEGHTYDAQMHVGTLITKLETMRYYLINMKNTPTTHP